MLDLIVFAWRVLLGKAPKITINNSTTADVSARVMSDGEIVIDIGQRASDRLPTRR